MYKRSIGGWAKHWDFIFFDTLCLQMSYFLAYYIRFHSFAVYTVVGNRTTYRTTGLVLLFLSIVIAIFFNTMHNVLSRSVWEEVKNTIKQCGLVFGAIIILVFSDKASDNISRIVLYATVGIYTVLSFIIRMIYKQILISHIKKAKTREMLLVGDEIGIDRAMAAFEAHPEAGLSIKKVVRADRDEINTIAEYIRNEWIDEVYIACYDYSTIPDKLIAQCDEMAVTVHQQIYTNEKVKGRLLVEKIAKQPVLTTSISIPKPSQLFIKRVIDIIAGFFMSLAACFVLLIVTPIIKNISPGPVLLKLERVGMNGRKFKMFMIRTMYMDAGNRDDKLIKGVGQFLRHWKLDELPKGFNILMGQMSLVGTRAPSPSEWDKYEYRHRARLSCKPGLTGLWQASGKSKQMGFEEATKLDTEYIKNWSLGLDWQIIIKTAMLRN